VLVNNAGIDGAPGGDEGDFARALEVNVTGLYNSTQVFGEAEGRIDRQHRLAVHVDRAHSRALRPDRAAVHEAGRLRRVQAAVANLTRYYAPLGPYGVRVNALCRRGGKNDVVELLVANEPAS
jgi:NAD(P)-dependent dehydrogenase (short-subunit alcohol dehydrogenase family)